MFFSSAGWRGREIGIDCVELDRSIGRLRDEAAPSFDFFFSTGSGRMDREFRLLGFIEGVIAELLVRGKRS